MPHALVNNRVHVIFSTKHREDLIPEDAQPRLWAFIGGIARNNGFTALAVGGTGNHAHALLALPATVPLAKAVQLIKGGSSKWCNENLSRHFSWQGGLRRFQREPVPETSSYSLHAQQRGHHSKHTFEQELKEILVKSETPFDPNEVLG